jgi:UDP-N-acetylglucosamine enolpyruvyl transferase
MAADGQSEIDHAELIDRGYVAIDERLNSLDAKIERVD